MGRRRVEVVGLEELGEKIAEVVSRGQNGIHEQMRDTIKNKERFVEMLPLATTAYDAVLQIARLYGGQPGTPAYSQNASKAFDLADKLGDLKASLEMHLEQVAAAEKHLAECDAEDEEQHNNLQ